ncbi:MAG: hypothetical protein IJ053_06920 [Lachnospiraceae bacterium]|nr:hypothetical protein [Lachnospiraceae bacterium]
MIKKYISRLLAVIMLISGIIVCPVDDIKAVETSDQGTTVGMEFIEVDEFFDVDDADTDDLHVVDSYAIDIYSTDFYTFDYDTATGTDADVYEEAEYYVYSSTAESYISTKDFSVYGNSYLRNYLTEDEKAFYDSLDDACRKYLTTTMDANKNGYSTGGVSKTAYLIAEDGFDYSAIGADRASEIISIFVYQNPQYYFISYKTLKSSSAGKYYLLSYEAFADGILRADTTEQMFTRVDGWVDDIKTQETDYDKEKKADDIICANTIYKFDTDTPYSEFESEGWLGYCQSAYSMVMLGKTVCAGYSKTFEMLMNASGILTIGITSSDHAWDKIRLNGTWYNVDVTWNDGNGTRTSSTRNYLNKTDNYFVRTGHYQESFYDDIAPLANKDFDEEAYYAYYNSSSGETGTSTGESSTDEPSTDEPSTDTYAYIPITGISVKPDDDLVFRLYDNSLTYADISVDVTPDNATNKDYHVYIGDDSVAYYKNGTIYAYGAGETTVTVKSVDEINGEPLSVTRKIVVYDKYDAPGAPSVAGTTAASVTLNAMAGCEYSLDKVNWQSQTTFTGLNYSTKYTFYARRAANGYYIQSDAGGGTTVKTDPLNNATVTSSGIYVVSTSPSVVAGCVTEKSDDSVSLEYRWLAYSESDNRWLEVSPWTKDNEWINWQPEQYGNYILLCYVRVVGNEENSQISVTTGVSAHPYIKGKCQMPYWGEDGGYLIGVESYDNPNQEYSYEMLILDCTLLAQNLPAWTYTTGKQSVSSGSAMWTIWQPEYGYYWTLFRVYDKNGTLIDEECYGFANVY